MPVFSKLMLITVGAGVANALPIIVPDGQENRVVDLDSSAGVALPACPSTCSTCPDAQFEEGKCCYNIHNDLCSGDNEEQCIGPNLAVCSMEHGPAPSPAPSPSPSPSAGLSSCAKKVPMPSGTIWKQASSTNSCKSESGIRGDTGFACANDKDEVDRSSIFVDMSATPDKVGCFVWETDDCKYSMKRVKQIDFDVEWSGCEKLWMAPLWTYSDPWSPGPGPHKDLQGYSGEVDFVEECPLPNVHTNLGCYNAGKTKPGGEPSPGSTNPADADYCLDGSNGAPQLARGASSNGPMHMTMTLDASGDLNVLKCNPNSCQTVATYHNYIGKVYPTTGGRNNLYKFMSDVFNDHGGDPGWGGCKAQKNSGTNCKYAVTNIKITSNDVTPMFPPTDKCSVLNAA